ncbi:MAG: hypothetical protein IRZ03_18815 [Acidobacterium ailaaui]|nr:hypothetical protein [Pseudacidobacterium ailaaui]
MARFQEKGIKLEAMKNWQSMDWGVYDDVKIYDGVCASTNLGYIWTLIDKWLCVDVLGEGLDPDDVEWGGSSDHGCD